MTKPSIALSKKSSSLAPTSSKKMLGDLPRTSSVTGMRFCDAYCMISRPVVVSPVKAILATRFEEASGLPDSRPKPLTMLRTPFGMRSPMISINTMIEAGICSALENDAVSRGQRRRHLPDGHQDREIPGNDLAHD